MDKMPMTKKSVRLLLAGLIVMVAGYVLLAGGGVKDPEVFNYAMFDFRRLVAAPIVIDCRTFFSSNETAIRFCSPAPALIASAAQANVARIVFRVCLFMAHSITNGFPPCKAKRAPGLPRLMSFGKLNSNLLKGMRR